MTDVTSFAFLNANNCHSKQTNKKKSVTGEFIQGFGRQATYFPEYKSLGLSSESSEVLGIPFSFLRVFLLLQLSEPYPASAVITTCSEYISQVSF